MGHIHSSECKYRGCLQLLNEYKFSGHINDKHKHNLQKLALDAAKPIYFYVNV